VKLHNHHAFSTTSSDSGNESDTNETAEEAVAAAATAAEERAAETMEFKAETRQLLDIVTHSLYTDKEVFLRELISNASDALEKLRHVQVTNEHATIDSDMPLEIQIETNEVDSTLTISDTGIGLTKDEMVTNLGTIARSGSKAFVQDIAEGSKGNPNSAEISSDIIGKFGVGFYSAFMVGDKVEVRSKSAIESKSEEEEPHVWSSTGIGTFDISALSPDIRQNRGSSIVIHLKEGNEEFCNEATITKILKKYSNFVNFPIMLNGNRVNTQEAIWSLDPKNITDEMHTAFYKFVATAYDEPLYNLHFRADAPLDVKALFYVPSFHTEKHGMGRMEPGVNLYSKKVLVESKSADILPDWLRFVKGVVDSEDLPLSISRERSQDTALIKKLKKVLTRRFISFLATKAKKDPDTYKAEFFPEYGHFLKEGICQDFEFQDQLSKLLYFETSKTMDGELSSLDEYVSRCTPDQKEIYYLCAPNRELALNSPYLEAFNSHNKEVIFVYSAIDDFVMSNLRKFENRELITAEKGDLDFGDNDKEDGDDDDDDETSDDAKAVKGLSKEQATEFCHWLQETLPDQIESAKTTTRLVDSPAVVTDHESGALKRMMRMVDTQSVTTGAGAVLPKQNLEINPKHDLIVGIDRIRQVEPRLAKVCAEQVFDNCLVAAGLLEDGRSMLPRLNDILLCVVKGGQDGDKESDKMFLEKAEKEQPASKTNDDKEEEKDSSSQDKK